MNRIFLLSPANLGGPRAMLLRDRAATAPLARALRTPVGAPLGEVMTFTSSLYFRGKMAYGRAFASPPPGAPGMLVITPSAGLCSPDAHCTVETLDELAGVDIAAKDERYSGPLRASAVALAEVAAESELVLLGSIATGKYTDVLLEIFGSRLLFPSDFVGRGDMSRGGLMLRCAAERRELAYEPVSGAVRHGKRPAKLPSRRRRAPRRPDRTESL